MSTKAKKPKVKKAQAGAHLCAKVRQQIEKSNAAFARMSRDEKKVQIAKDVLAQLDAGHLVAANGVYFLSDDAYKIFNRQQSDPRLQVDIKEVLVQTPQCQVCALGAAFVCAVERQGLLKSRNLGDAMMDSSMCNYLSYNQDIFMSSESRLIEAAFEGFERPSDEDPDGSVKYFNHNIASAETQMRRVMKAIIAAGGHISAETFTLYDDDFNKKRA